MKYLIALLLITPAYAQVTQYSYGSGWPLPNTVTGHNGVLLYADITLAAPLAPNLNNAAVTPLAWDMSNLLAVVTQTAVFKFSTDSAGNITGWHFYGVAYDLSANATASSESDSVMGDQETSQTGSQIDIFALTDPPGGWVLKAATAPDPPAPDPMQAQLNAANAQIASLQKQLTHVTAQMTVYRSGTVFYESEYLAAYSMLCKAKLTGC